MSDPNSPSSLRHVEAVDGTHEYPLSTARDVAALVEAADRIAEDTEVRTLADLADEDPLSDNGTRLMWTAAALLPPTTNNLPPPRIIHQPGFTGASTRIGPAFGAEPAPQSGSSAREASTRIGPGFGAEPLEAPAPPSGAGFGAEPQRAEPQLEEEDPFDKTQPFGREQIFGLEAIEEQSSASATLLNPAWAPAARVDFAAMSLLPLAIDVAPPPSRDVILQVAPTPAHYGAAPIRQAKTRIPILAAAIAGILVLGAAGAVTFVGVRASREARLARNAPAVAEPREPQLASKPPVVEPTEPPPLPSTDVPVEPAASEAAAPASATPRRPRPARSAAPSALPPSTVEPPLPPPPPSVTVAPLPPPAPAPAPAAAPAPTTGTILVPPSMMTVMVDGDYKRVQAGRVVVTCGKHKVNLGRGTQVMDVPCGGVGP